MNKPLVSISCITYNHGDFIEKCIESLLIQKTSFDFEILVHDDASTDRTVQIIQRYKDKYPKIIKPIFQKENQFSQGIRGIAAKFNFSRAKGKYIAICEGDDYWTDPLKLQKQVDFMENNPDFSIVFHQIQVLENNILTNEIYPLTEKVKSISTIEDLSKVNYIPTLSVLFKNQFSFPSYIKESFIGDYPLHLHNAETGKIKFMPEIMGVYRKGVGIWSSEVDLIRTEKMLKSLFLISDYYKKNKVIHRNLLLQQKFYFYEYLKGTIVKNQSVFSFVFRNELFKNSTLEIKLYVIIKFLLKK